MHMIFKADFRDIKQAFTSDAMIITDPPYNIGYKYDEYSDILPDEEYIKLIGEFKDKPLAIIHYPEETMRYFVPALGAPHEVLVWCYNSNLARQSRLISVYNRKVNFGAVTQPYKNPNDKRIIKYQEKTGAEGARIYDWFSDIQQVKNVSKDKFEHPCPIPIKLIERIILLTTKEGDTVIDPFMGVGTTGIACRNTNRDFIGMEISQEYFNIAKGRLDG